MKRSKKQLFAFKLARTERILIPPETSDLGIYDPQRQVWVGDGVSMAYDTSVGIANAGGSTGVEDRTYYRTWVNSPVTNQCC
jgi:hypothetical protein